MIETTRKHATVAKLRKITRTDFAFPFSFNAFSGLAGSVGGSWEGQAELGFLPGDTPVSFDITLGGQHVSGRKFGGVCEVLDWSDAK